MGRPPVLRQGLLDSEATRRGLVLGLPLSLALWSGIIATLTHWIAR